eukprot:1422150-Prymnesium_polylepis.2
MEASYDVTKEALDDAQAKLAQGGGGGGEAAADEVLYLELRLKGVRRALVEGDYEQSLLAARLSSLRKATASDDARKPLRCAPPNRARSLCTRFATYTFRTLRRRLIGVRRIALCTPSARTRARSGSTICCVSVSRGTCRPGGRGGRGHAG